MTTHADEAKTTHQSASADGSALTPDHQHELTALYAFRRAAQLIHSLDADSCEECSDRRFWTLWNGLSDGPGPEDRGHIAMAMGCIAAGMLDELCGGNPAASESPTRHDERLIRLANFVGLYLVGFHEPPLS